MSDTPGVGVFSRMIEEASTKWQCLLTPASNLQRHFLEAQQLPVGFNWCLIKLSLHLRGKNEVVCSMRRVPCQINSQKRIYKYLKPIRMHCSLDVEACGHLILIQRESVVLCPVGGKHLLGFRPIIATRPFSFCMITCKWSKKKSAMLWPPGTLAGGHSCPQGPFPFTAKYYSVQLSFMTLSMPTFGLSYLTSKS